MTHVLRSALLALSLSACNGHEAIQPDSATLDPEIRSLEISFPNGVNPIAMLLNESAVVTATVVDLAGRTIESGTVVWTISDDPLSGFRFFDRATTVARIDDRRAILRAGDGCDLLTGSIRRRYSSLNVTAAVWVCNAADTVLP